MTPRHHLSLAATLLLLAICPAVQGAGEVDVIEIEGKSIPEASGATASVLHRDVLWIVNDGPAGTVLHAVSPEGKILGAVSVTGIRTSDVEDLASFAWNGTPHLLIADVGDNSARKGTYTLHAIPEPSPEARTVKPSWSLRFRYEDGPHNCEALTIDQDGKQILIITKDKDTTIYSLPIGPNRGVAVAKSKGNITWGRPINIGIQNTLRHLVTGSLATGMDLSPDGRLAAVLTYNHICLYERKEGESWDVSLRRDPDILKMPTFSQAEAVSFSPDGRSIWVISENLPAKMAKISVP